MTIEITFDGAPVAARRGESLFAALAAAGHLALRETAGGEARGGYCGMGVCQECLVEIDGVPNQRACMVKLTRPVRVRRARDPLALDDAWTGRAPRRIDDVPLITPDVLVIGAGPAGLAAAIAARANGAEVLVLDERATPGGQYYKQLAIEHTAPPADRQHREGAATIDRAIAAGADLRMGTTVWGAFPGPEFAATGDGSTLRLRPRCTIIATGAHERGWPVLGWTLPGVMTTGAAQTMWRTARRLPGKRVLIAGNGPLNLQLAAELIAGGADVVGLVEAARAPGLGDASKLIAMARYAPQLVADGMGYLARLRAASTPIFHGSVITAIDRDEQALIATVDGRSIKADIICLGYGLRPSNELGRALGMDFHHDARGYLVPERTLSGETSIPGVFVIGDGAGLGGAQVAMAEGTLAGLAAAERLGHVVDTRARNGAMQRLNRHRRFQYALWRLYAPVRPLTPPQDPQAILCRCEAVRFADVTAAIAEGYGSPGAIKQRTRIGMGRCQGRYCTPELEDMIGGDLRDGHTGFAPRVPVRPVVIGDLAR